MQERIEIQQACKRAGVVRRLASCMVLAVAAFVVSGPLMSTAYRVYRSVAKDQYELYRARTEHSLLQAANARMRSELISLRSTRSKEGHDRESSLAQKISELEQLIESVTSLGVFHDRKGRFDQSFARNKKKEGSSKEKDGTLAAILHSPQLAGTQGGSDDAKGEGLGGAEDPCLGDSCRNEAHREDVALSPEEASQEVVQANAAVSNVAHERLVERINRFISVVQILPLGAPVKGLLTSGFGHRRSPFSHRASFHYGVDVSLRVGSAVMATGAGRVIKVAHDRTYGTMVDIQHTPTLVTRYAHLSKVLVHAGQNVDRGTVIALSGNTGRSTGPHLHYEVRHNGKARNPTPFVQLAGRLSQFVDLAGSLRS